MKSLLYATTLLATPLLAAPVPLLKTAATVNGKMITTREVQQQLAPTIAMLMAKYPRRGEQFQKALTEAHKEVLDQLIEHKLVLSKLEEKQLQIPDHIVKQDIEQFIRINFKGSQEEFRKYLKAIRMTRREFQKSQQEKILVQSFKREQFKDVPNLHFANLGPTLNLLDPELTGDSLHLTPLGNRQLAQHLVGRVRALFL